MKVLYVTGSCLSRNTSANMSHNAFVKGLLDNDCEVDVLMAAESWGEEDLALPRMKEARYITYSASSYADRWRKRFSGTAKAEGTTAAPVSQGGQNTDRSLGTQIRHAAKKLFYVLFPNDPLYPLEKKWLIEAGKFKSCQTYDLVLSNSSPAASHKLVAMLTEKGSLCYKRWVQVWEDPWYYDLYGGYSEQIREEEHRLLRAAGEIYYVSPLTWMYQKRHFPDCAEKMKFTALPFLDFSREHTITEEKKSFGYFGDYYAKTRNIGPFYEALSELGYPGYIYGDGDVFLPATAKIEISGRVTLDKLSKVQEQTSILVHLSNLKGGQIPGKIYHYSATTKPILFILDGTAEEKEHLYRFFSKYDRYVFCENESDKIATAMRAMVDGPSCYEPVAAFSPREVVKKILET